jgi:hypothetical protein
MVEGRSRESIWRDGRWWDELAMSVLESDWRAARGTAFDAVVPDAIAPPLGEPVGAGASDRLRRTFGRWR